MNQIPLPTILSRCALFLVLAALPFHASAQVAGKKKHGFSPDANVPSSSAVSGKAYLRIWKADLPGVKSVHFTLQQQSSGGSQKRDLQELAAVGPGYQFNEYIEVPEGRCTLTSSEAGQEHPLSILLADFATNSYCTLLVSPSVSTGAAPRMELIVDAVAASARDTKALSPVQFSVRNLAAGVHDLRVSVGEQLTAQFAAEGGILHMVGLKPGVYGIRTTGKDAEGKPFEWTTEGNFDRFPQQTLLIYPDAYGRIRPRLNIDGPSATQSSTRPVDQS